MLRAHDVAENVQQFARMIRRHIVWMIFFFLFICLLKIVLKFYWQTRKMYVYKRKNKQKLHEGGQRALIAFG